MNHALLEQSDEHIEALRVRGYTVIPSVLTSAEVAEGRAALDEIFRREAPTATVNGWHNGVYKAAYMLTQKHPFFWSLCQGKTVLALVRAVLGADCILSAVNGLSMVPGGLDQPLHIDQYETIPGAILSINALHTLDDFTRRNGGTRLVPGSQNRVWTDHAVAIDAAETEAVHVEAPAGSVIAYDGAVWHAGSRNETASDRRAIHVFYVRKWVAPHWDFPRSLPPGLAASLTDEQRQLLGFSARPSRYDARRNRETQSDPDEGRWRSMMRRVLPTRRR